VEVVANSKATPPDIGPSSRVVGSIPSAAPRREKSRESAHRAQYGRPLRCRAVAPWAPITLTRRVEHPAHRARSSQDMIGPRRGTAPVAPPKDRDIARNAVRASCTRARAGEPPSGLPQSANTAKLTACPEGKRMVSGLTRNQVPRKGLRVRIPCPPLELGQIGPPRKVAKYSSREPTVANPPFRSAKEAIDWLVSDRQGRSAANCWLAIIDAVPKVGGAWPPDWPILTNIQRRAFDIKKAGNAEARRAAEDAFAVYTSSCDAEVVEVVKVYLEKCLGGGNVPDMRA
jgi:hypothetical protein